MKTIIMNIIISIVLSCNGSIKSSIHTCNYDEINVSGNAFSFPGYAPISDAEIEILELPEKVAITETNGFFSFACLPIGGEATFIMKNPGYPEIQTKTFILPETDLQRVTFQAPDFYTYNGIVSIVNFEPDVNACQIVTTVTKPGGTIYERGAHGEEDVTVELGPVIDPEHGPIYFNDNVLPDRSLIKTSSDGGVLFINVPPGKYTIKAFKKELEFVFPIINCRAGVLVNASPPYALEAIY